MERKLPENIRFYRKERGMTQEALAELLGLTLGTISKWERGSSEPDLGYLMQLADVFHVSVDALLGFSIKGTNAEDLCNSISDHVSIREFDLALQECGSILSKFPNHFKVVYTVAMAYFSKGYVEKNEECIRKAKAYFQHSLDLFSQSEDHFVSEIEIRNRIAECHMALKEYQKGIDLLRKNNVGGINDPDIAALLIGKLGQTEEGVLYAKKAFVERNGKMINILASIMNYQIKSHQYNACLETVDWSFRFFNLLKKDPSKPAFVDKFLGSFEMIRAICLDALGEEEKAKEGIREAIRIAEGFDAAPCFDLRNIVFMDDQVKGSFMDDFATTAIAGLSESLKEVREAATDRFPKMFQEELKQNARNAES